MFIIRRYNRSTDHDTVWDLHNLALLGVGAHAGEGVYDDLHNVEAVYFAKRGEFLVGIYSGQLVAMGAFWQTNPTTAEIKRMRVHPDYQGRGLGQAILEELEKRAKLAGYRTLHLETSVQQIAAQKLYTRNGFVETGRAVIHKFDCIIYEKTIA